MPWRVIGGPCRSVSLSLPGSPTSSKFPNIYPITQSNSTLNKGPILLESNAPLICIFDKHLTNAVSQFELPLMTLVFPLLSPPSFILVLYIDQNQVLFQHTQVTIDIIVTLPRAGQDFMKLDIFALMFGSEHEIQICVLALRGLGL